MGGSSLDFLRDRMDLVDHFPPLAILAVAVFSGVHTCTQSFMLIIVEVIALLTQTPFHLLRDHGSEFRS